ncbi:hypothetical protein F4776DRAFT_667018 [Hypoxylon sp. NC0597]|nr:hypothetical protein F4776DRAFT_667018 [Hypoxylon sp. NC0597]
MCKPLSYPAHCYGAYLWATRTKGASLSLAPSRFLSFQWNSGSRFEEYLQGRVTLTALAIPYTGVPVPELWCSAVYSTFGEFLPRGCEDLRVQWPRSRMHFRRRRPGWTATSRSRRQQGETRSRRAMMPSVTAWVQERWDIQLAPCFIAPEEEEEEEEDEGLEDEEYEQNKKEFLKQYLSPR